MTPPVLLGRGGRAAPDEYSKAGDERHRKEDKPDFQEVLAVDRIEVHTCPFSSYAPARRGAPLQVCWSPAPND